MKNKPPFLIEIFPNLTYTNGERLLLCKLKVYIETTIFNRYFEDGREYCAESRALFEKIISGGIDAYTSVAVLEELEKAPGPKREQMLPYPAV